MTVFKHKSVLVLGGSRGIGAAIVRRFASDGASVVFSYAGSREAAEELAKESGSTAVLADSADRDALLAQAARDKRLRPISALTGDGIEALLAAIDERLSAGKGN